MDLWCVQEMCFLSLNHTEVVLLSSQQLTFLINVSDKQPYCTFISNMMWSSDHYVKMGKFRKVLHTETHAAACHSSLCEIWQNHEINLMAFIYPVFILALDGESWKWFNGLKEREVINSDGAENYDTKTTFILHYYTQCLLNMKRQVDREDRRITAAKCQFSSHEWRG